MIRRTSVEGSMLAALFILLLAVPTVASVPDAVITAKTKMTLLTTEGLSAMAVNVDTINGQVTLHGKVGSAEEKAKAEAIAKNIDGARAVQNLLQVVPAPQEKSVEQSDAVIKTHVEKALQAHKFGNDTHIAVRSVNQGVVLLDGTAQTLTDHLSALEIATKEPGVRRVASEIQSPNTLADAEIWHSGAPQASDAVRGMGEAARDLWITSATKMRLLADRRTPALDVNVDTRDGVVTLFGMVPSHEAKAAAEADAHKVSGVKHVVNELQIVPKAKQEAVRANDEDIKRELKKSFGARTDLWDVKLDVKNCVARLTGTVPSATQGLDAAVVARSAPGVCSVENDLRVRSGDVPVRRRHAK